ncbi:MAG: 30S ribosomal protein S16, partial [Pirellulales bacterium]
DPLVPETDARVVLNGERVNYWIGVGAQPTEKVAVFIKKYGAGGTHTQASDEARAKLSLPKLVPPPPEVIAQPKPKKSEAPAEEAAAEEAAPVEEAS